MRSKISFAAIVASLIITCATAPAAWSAPADDACLLVTQAQVSAALDASMAAGAHTTPTYLKTCTWTPAGGATQDIRAVTLNLESANGYEAGRKMLDSMKTMKQESVSGIGDDAFYSIAGSTIASLIVKKGNISFKVAIYGALPTEKKKAAEKAIALQVLSKL